MDLLIAWRPAIVKGEGQEQQQGLWAGRKSIVGERCPSFDAGCEDFRWERCGLWCWYSVQRTCAQDLKLSWYKGIITMGEV